MFGLGAKRSFGIDIGTQTIKIAELQKRGGSYQVVNYAVWSDSLNEVLQEKGGKRVSSAKHIAGIIQNMMKQAGMNIEEAYFAIPSYLAFSAVVDFPMMSDEELTNAVPLEAKQYIPVPIEDVQVDWINLGKSEKMGGVQVLLMAIPNTVVAKYLKIARLLGIEVKGFELDVFSQIRSISLDPKVTCVVDVGARTSSVSILGADQQLMLTRSYDVGGNQITNQIASTKEVSSEEAESLKKGNGLNGSDEKTVQVVQSVMKNFIANDVGSLLREYESKNGNPVEHLVIVGGISRMRGVREFFETEVHGIGTQYSQVQVGVAEPTQKVSVKPGFEQLFRESIWQDVALAVGIALREG